MTSREIFYRLKPIISIFCKVMSFVPYRFNFTIFNMFKNSQGVFGLFLRYILMRNLFANCGDDVRSYPNVYIYNIHKMKVGSNVTFREMCYIDANGGVEIGSNVMLAQSASIITTTHNYDNLDLNINEQGGTWEKVIIEDNVWIGAKATILPGVTVHSGSIVGSNAVVTKDVPANAIVVGVPAKVIKYRGKH